MDTNHYIVTINNHDIEIHTRNILERKSTEAITVGVKDFYQSPSNGVLFGQLYNVSDNVALYRKMCEDEAKASIMKNGLVNQMEHKQKWVSESLRKVLNFQNKNVPADVRKGEKILKMAVDKKFYEGFRKELVPQFQSKKLTKNIYHFEGIKPGRFQSLADYEAIPKTVKRNIGIHHEHVESINKNIKSIQILDPKNPIVKNGFLRFLSANKLKVGMLGLSVIIDAVTITLSVIEDKNQFGKSTTVTLSNAIGSTAGAAIGAAIGSIIPGIGTIVGGILGGIIFGLIGTTIGYLFCGLFPEVAEGPGAPDPDYLQFIYGDNENFAIPLPDYNLIQSGLPMPSYESSEELSQDYDLRDTSVLPKPDYQDLDIYGPPKSDYE
jgi:hypothetical protein